MQKFLKKLILVCLTTAAALINARVDAQRVQIPPNTFQGNAIPGSTNLVPVQPYGGAPIYGAPNGVLGTPTFDPYASANTAPTLFGPPAQTPYGVPAQGPSLFGQPASQPMFGQPPVGQPAFAQPYGSIQPPAYNPAYPAYPGTTPNPYIGQAPDSLFPNGITGWDPNNMQGFGEPLRLFDNLRLRDTWIAGGAGRELGMNDVEVATTLQLPNFLGTGQPLQVSPNFELLFLSGPQQPTFPGDLPARLYSAYVEGAMRSDPAKTFGGDLAVSVGVYSDFEAISTHSIRIQGLGYGFVRLTPTITFKLGVNYLDRVKIKLLPAGGIYWEPNPQTRLDFFFPKPKLSRYVTTLGNTDFWAYVAAEYGGGSWTMHHFDGTSDQVDINDVRLMLGTDITTQEGWKGMVEVGWVTHRELIYRAVTTDDGKLKDSVMIRAGIIW